MIIAYEIRCEIEGSNMETKEGSWGRERIREEKRKKKRKRKRRRKNSFHSHRKLCHIFRVIYFCRTVIDTKL